MIRFAFFYAGSNISEADMLVRSIKLSNPESEILQISNNDTNQVRGVTQLSRFNYPVTEFNHIEVTKHRLECYSQLSFDNTPTIFLDTDMLVIKKITHDDIFKFADNVFLKRWWNATINRPDPLDPLHSYHNKTLNDIWPYIACFIACQSDQLLKDLYSIIDQLSNEQKGWTIDQHAIKKLVESNKHSVATVSEYIYGCLPDQVDANLSYAKILHFKGNNIDSMRKLSKIYCVNDYSML
jgi:hypothetical protein